MSDPIAFIDLGAQQARIRDKVDVAIAKVLDHGMYINGPEILELEAQLGTFSGSEHVIGCASGTDALGLVLMARGLRPGDAVFVPAFTFIATGEAVAWLGATPVFVDVDPKTFNMDPRHLEASIATAREQGLKPACVIAVDLFGQPADYPALKDICDAEGLFLLADAAQSYGGALADKRVGSLGDAATTSFFPAKPLGCYGDGGAIFTDDADMADHIRSLRNHGAGADRYDNVRIGMNGRLDTIQAAILLEKLAIFEEELVSRQRIAERYNATLEDVATVPFVGNAAKSAWAQYTLRVADRDAVRARCQDAGIPTQVYYPIPLHKQTAYKHYPTGPGGLPVCDALAADVLSLPMHPYLDEATQDRIIESVRTAIAG
ncbi:DegT/DnrJ/EryC1/StrS family protein [Candidatus Phaeomarinobacter ectocarpi]|uniref:DegT/DnrJ/EryC1/StrS family protein n=1 Tax=Candidatus Phaeomarinibacter ectocarpi TaxID=1458461 RepID=X5ML95_9HYPH|nr:DegT/DnrJ/EryC1/StrS aminotransferase family protein [Candidatus Phaeomarinobacter ectocarpi]CDO59295.1 DegT/DnrJ/EryC1/StrS family protein [Candidatus Phaeomarinobacter ectocarpi]